MKQWLEQAERGAYMVIDLGAIADNWLKLKQRVGRALCASVIKANAYGLGAHKVAPVLAQAGCQHFFVAHLFEALQVLSHLSSLSSFGSTASVYVLHGLMPGSEDHCDGQRIVPVLNSLEQIQAWSRQALARGRTLRAVLQVDTGMSRLGLTQEAIAHLCAQPGEFQGLNIDFCMSHLACAEQPHNAFNEVQRQRFVDMWPSLQQSIYQQLGQNPIGLSLANSSGIFLGPQFHFDLVRPGAALFGIAPQVHVANPMRSVVQLRAKVIQVRSIAAGVGVGYGQTWRCAKETSIATIALGYADGWIRGLSNQGMAFFDGFALPIVGLISMDTLCLDISAVPPNTIRPGMWVEFLNEQHPVDAVAVAANTIAYEILTSLGARYQRCYIEPGGSITYDEVIS